MSEGPSRRPLQASVGFIAARLPDLLTSLLGRIDGMTLLQQAKVEHLGFKVSHDPWCSASLKQVHHAGLPLQAILRNRSIPNP